MENTPRVSFIFPYRWLTEDKEFLAENLRRKITGQSSAAGMQIFNPRTVIHYIVVLGCQSYKPMDIPIDQKELAKILKLTFPSGKLIEMEYEFTQTKSKTALPLMELQLFF